MGLSSFYGAGMYFASEACKALQYSNQRNPNSEGERCILLCRVTLGAVHYTDALLRDKSNLNQTSRRPPRVSGCVQPDSVVANPGPKTRPEGGDPHMQVHREFVVFER